MARLTEYSDERAAQALAVLESVHGNVKKAARLTGVPRTTLQGWAGRGSKKVKPKVVSAELVRDERQKLSEKWERTVNTALDRAGLEEVLSKASYKDLLVGAGIGTEKVELLQGRATSRSESLRIELVAGGSLQELASRTMSGTTTALPAVLEGRLVPTEDKEQT